MSSCPVCKNIKTNFSWDYKAYDIHLCTNCGLEFSIPFKQGDHSFYSQRNKTYSSAEKNPVPPFSVMKSILGVTRNFYMDKTLNILDYGCGFGGYSKELKKRGHNLVSSDFNPEVIKYIKEKHDLNSTTDSYVTLYEKNIKFDFIILNQVLEHIDQPNELFSGLKKLLVPNGLLFVSIPNKSYFKGNVSKKNLPSGNYPPHHVSFWDTEALRRFFKLNDFEPIFVKTDIWPCPSSLMQKLHLIPFDFIRNIISVFVSSFFRLFFIKGPYILGLGKNNES